MRKILVADDQDGYRSLLQRVLPGFEVYQERTAGTALMRAYQWNPDLLLLDLRMPDMHGQDLAKAIRRDPYLCTTPIIFVSAMIECEDEPNRLDGCLAFGKPFRIETLKRCILAELGEAETAGEAAASWLRG